LVVQANRVGVPVLPLGIQYQLHSPLRQKQNENGFCHRDWIGSPGCHPSSIATRSVVTTQGIIPTRSPPIQDGHALQLTRLGASLVRTPPSNGRLRTD